MNEQVTAYIENIEHDWQRVICTDIRQTIHDAIPQVEEQIKYNQAFYTLDGQQMCVFFPAKNWVNVTIFNAESIEAPDGFFEQTDKPERKTIKIREGQAFDYEVLIQCLQQIYEVKQKG